MKIRQKTAIILSGIIWMGVGIFLLTKGFSLLLHPKVDQAPTFLTNYMKSLAGNMEQGMLLLICFGLFIGFLKGRFVLSKTANRTISRIVSLSDPCSLSEVYSKGYVILLASMMTLGMALKWFPIPHDIKGLIDVIIGSALTNGSAFYFRHLAAQKKSV